MSAAPKLQIFTAMPAIMAEIGPISKSKVNTQQNFKFRGIDDVYNHVNSVMAKHGVFSLPTVLAERTEDRTSKSGSALIYRVFTIKYTFYASDGSFVEAIVIGEGMDSGDKASNKAMSIAHKYALLQAFCIITQELEDPDKESHEVSKPTVSRTPPVSTKEPGVYTGTETQQKIIQGLLTKQKVPEKFWGEVHNYMLGKPSTEIHAVIKEVRGAN